MSYGSTPEEKKVLDALGWSKFRESNNDQLKPIRELEEFKKRPLPKLHKHAGVFLQDAS